MEKRKWKKKENKEHGQKTQNLSTIIKLGPTPFVLHIIKYCYKCVFVAFVEQMLIDQMNPYKFD